MDLPDLLKKHSMFMGILEIMPWSNYFFLNTARVSHLFFIFLKMNKMRKPEFDLTKKIDVAWDIFCLKWLKHICKSKSFCMTKHDLYWGNADMSSDTPQDLTCYLMSDQWVKLLRGRSASACVEKATVVNTHSLRMVCYCPEHYKYYEVINITVITKHWTWDLMLCKI